MPRLFCPTFLDDDVRFVDSDVILQEMSLLIHVLKCSTHYGILPLIECTRLKCTVEISA